MLRHKLTEFLISDHRFRERSTIYRDNKIPTVSFLIPVHNQELIIAQNIMSIVVNASLDFELIVINDKSRDRTKEELDRILNSELLEKYDNCVAIKYYESTIPVYETKCDDFGISLANTEYVIEIQADMQLLEEGFDAKLLKILEGNPNLLGISGRATHKFEALSLKALERETSLNFDFLGIGMRFLHQIRSNFKSVGNYDSNLDTNSGKLYSEETIFPTDLDFRESGEAGWTGKNIDLIPSDRAVYDREIKRNYGDFLWCGQTIIRGPMILRKSVYLALGGFDTKSYYLGNDDHDLCIRAQSRGYQMGFTPIHFIAPLIMGTERKRKSLMSFVWREIHRFARAEQLSQSPLCRLLKFGEVSTLDSKSKILRYTL